MKNLWNPKEAKLFSKSKLQHRVYSSRLLGRDPELVLHGGGNTSVKGHYILRVAVGISFPLKKMVLHQLISVIF